MSGYLHFCIIIVMNRLKKYWKEVFAVIGIASLFFLLRLIVLTDLPIFTDEAIYIRWAQIALQDPNWRFISLTDGKQPLFIWVMVILMKFIEDPLLAGRLVSVIGGAMSVVGVWFVAYELFKRRKIAYFSSLLYVCFPFAQVADRMALYDSLSGAFTLWALYFSILLVRNVKLHLAYTLGIAIGLGVLNKSTNFFSIYLLPFTILLFDFSKKERIGRLIKWFVLALLVVAVAQGMYAVLRLSALYHMIGLKNDLFIYPFNEWIQHPFEFVLGNLRGLTNWVLEYLNVSYVVLIAFAFRNKKFLREKLLLVIFFIVPFVALALFARIVFPRFIFFMTLSLLPLAAYGLNDILDLTGRILKKTSTRIVIAVKIFIVVLILAYPLFVSIQFALDPIHSKIAKPDREQYVNYWTAGWGVVETVDFISSEAETKKVFVATEGTFGLMPFGLEIYLIKNPNITIKGYWPLNNAIPDEVKESSKSTPTYMVFYQPNHVVPPDESHLKLIFQKQSGSSEFYYRLYQVIGY